MSQEFHKKIAIIDIDGTLIDGQIQQGLINYLYKKGELGFWYMVKLNIWFVLYKLHLVDDMKKVFEFGLRYLRGKSVDKVGDYIDEYIVSIVRPKIYAKSFELMKKLRSEGYTLVILSTAVDAVVKKIAGLFDVDDYICTKLEIHDGLYTGHISGDIAYGDFKVSLLKGYLNSGAYSLEDVVAYADHESDIPMLKIVGKAFIANPDAKMRRLSIQYKFDTIDLRNP